MTVGRYREPYHCLAPIIAAGNEGETVYSVDGNLTPSGGIWDVKISSEEQQEGAGDNPKTARSVGQLGKYSREVNQSGTVGEVGTYALEATFHVMNGEEPSPNRVIVGIADDGSGVAEEVRDEIFGADFRISLERP